MIAPLLVMILADGKSLVTLAVPSALIEQSREVLLRRFSGVLLKRVHTLDFDRCVRLEFERRLLRQCGCGCYPLGCSSCDEARKPSLLRSQVLKLKKAQLNRGVVITTPDSIKSIMLKFVDSAQTLGDLKQLQSSAVQTEGQAKVLGARIQQKTVRMMEKR